MSLNSNLKNFIDNSETNNYRFINDTLKDDIEQVVITFIPKLNKNDNYILTKLTLFIVDIISFKYSFEKNR